MKTALAIFVKTPGLSPVKTRLAAGIGACAAEHFHRLAATAVAEVASACSANIETCWAVAEELETARKSWPQFPAIDQGSGTLGARLDRVYSRLMRHHDRVLLVGVDSPQMTVRHLATAVASIDNPRFAFVMGDAVDGGFWLFGGRVSIPADVWRSVAFSRADTGENLRDRLPAPCDVDSLPCLVDVDTAADLPLLRQALAGLDAPFPAQHRLCDWLDSMSPDPRTLEAVDSMTHVA